MLNMNIEDETVINNPSWWRRRTALEKSCTLISIVGIIAVAVLSLSLVNVLLAREKTTSNDVPNNVCLTPGCIHAASQIFNAMDTTVEPCDDFYNFACGSFIKNTQIPDEKTFVDESSIIEDRLQEQLRTLMSEEPKSDEPKAFKLAKDLFTACMNKSLIEQRGLEPFKSISDSLGGWPVVKGNSWDDRSWTWIQSVKDFRKAGFKTNYILDFSVQIDSKNTLSRSIYMDGPSTGVNVEYLINGLEDKIVQAYYAYMVNTAVIFGADRKRAERELNDTLNFEIALAKIIFSADEVFNYTYYNPMSLAEMQQKFKYVPSWVEYINTLLSSGLSVDEKEIVIVIMPKFFEELGALLKNTPKRIIANYVMCRMTTASYPYLNEDIRKIRLTYLTASTGLQEHKPRWKACIGLTIDSLPISVGALYVRRYFQQCSQKKESVEMVRRIRAQFEMILGKNTWMDAKTKAAALKKLKAMKMNIGYPDELMDNLKLEQYYSALEVNTEEYLESMLRLEVFSTDYEYNRLRKPVNKTDWVDRDSAVKVNAGYNPSTNFIELASGILQGQYFSTERPRYMNYGAIGFWIGHEITHGFDNEGRKYDFNGNLVDWWKPKTVSQYLEKSSCIIAQYGNYTEPITKLKVNGTLTQGENIADNGGIKESYHAYLKWIEENTAEPTLPGLNYTPLQLFWVSFAQQWCAVYREEQLKWEITTDDHSPVRFRVLGPLKNMKDFAKDFNCPMGSPMNPKDKCELW